VLIVLLAGFCNAIPTVLNGAIGASLHIPFPIAARASFGYWFSYFAVVSRGILAMFWFGVQTANGGACVTVVLSSLWPSYRNIPNILPALAGLTSAGMVSYFIYWLLQFPLLLIPTHKFWFTTILTPPRPSAWSYRSGSGPAGRASSSAAPRRFTARSVPGFGCPT
jgi:nucleobase:cation symporter-1, NCS1 family